MDDLVAESCRNCERATIDERSRCCRGERAGMANIAANRVEERIATRRSRRNRVLTTGSARCRHEVSKRQHIISIIFRIRNWIERRRERYVDNTFSSAGRVLLCSPRTVKRVGNAHFIEIGIACERNQTRMLSFPAESSDAQGVVCFGYRNLRESSTLCEWLSSNVILERCV